MATVNNTIWKSLGIMINRKAFSAPFPIRKKHKVEAVLEDRKIDDILSSISRDIALNNSMNHSFNK